MKAEVRLPPLRFSRPRLLAGVLPEPKLLFGGRNLHVDPKTGLAIYGPYNVADQDLPSMREIRVGLVSPGSLAPHVRGWLTTCQHLVTNEGTQPLLYPHFPGMSQESPFQCEISISQVWNESIDDKRLLLALGEIDFYARVAAVAALYREGVENISERDPRPDVIVCAIPQEVEDVCGIEEAHGFIRRRKLTKGEKVAVSRRDAGQLSFLPARFGDEEEETPGHRNLRRAIKAETMPYGIPTQLVRERTVHPEAGGSRRRLQDPATRAWNFTVGLYYKAGGHPWRVTDLPSDTCYVGIHFYRERLRANALMRTSLAQIFSHRGDGLVLRGRPFEWGEPGRSPHLARAGAAELMQDVLAMYRRQNLGRLPARLVIHKSSRYWDEELAGFLEPLVNIPVVDLISFGRRGIQLMRPGSYPPLRGTWEKFDEGQLLLYTRGYIPYLQTYPGMRAPQPLEILEHHGPTAADVILGEILALTKMNWNTADFSCGDPMTLAFAEKVGEILGEMPLGVHPNAEYRFYM